LFSTIIQEFNVNFSFEQFLFEPALGHFFLPLFNVAAFAAFIENAIEFFEDVPPRCA
jgi:hypothetical protein